MPFKYDANIQLIKGCPPNAAKEAHGIAYRFVFNPLDGKSFLPPALVRRVNRPRTKWECSDWALSMFESRQAALRYFADLARKSPLIRKTLGDHIATVRLTVRLAKAHGRQTAADKDGHFDLHEYVGVDLSSVTRLGEKL